LLLARDRFLSPNNATLTIIGGIQTNRAMRALRQLLGVWRKSEQLVPATFKQPATPDPRTLIVNAPSDQSVEVRFAVRGFSRQDADSPAAAVVAIVARQRWTKLIPELSRSPVYVRHGAFALPGMFVMGASVDTLLAGKTLASAKEIMQSLASSPVTAAELEQAKNELITQAGNELVKPDGVADAWLDGDTYALASTADRMRALAGVTASDLQRVAARLIHEGAFASVVLGNSEVVKAQLERYGKVEVMGEIAPGNEPGTEPKTTPKSESKVKNQVRSPAKP
jgi:predicted Zn-dependent peptidase